MNVKKKILYITQVCFLDATIEHFSTLKSEYDIHLVIQLTPNERKSNILDISESLDALDYLVPFSDIVRPWNLEILLEHFAGHKVFFLTYKKQFNLWDLFKGTSSLYRYISDFNPDVIHLDDISGRQIFILPLLFSKRDKLVINIHDPKLHSGESSIVLQITRKFLYSIARRFITFSVFSKELLEAQLPSSKTVYTIKLLPYSVFKSLASNSVSQPDTISFVGRISPYKGIELFLDAIELVIQRHPKQKFVIAGKPVHGYNLSHINPDLLGHNVSIVEKHLTNQEVVDIISKSSIVVCPYLDATQSGIILTSYALERPVLVTNVGGLPEYVIDGETGFVAREASARALADEMIKFLDGNYFGKMSENLGNALIKEANERENLKLLSAIYNSN